MSSRIGQVRQGPERGVPLPPADPAHAGLERRGHLGHKCPLLGGHRYEVAFIGNLRFACHRLIWPDVLCAPTEIANGQEPCDKKQDHQVIQLYGDRHPIFQRLVFEMFRCLGAGFHGYLHFPLTSTQIQTYQI